MMENITEEKQRGQAIPARPSETIPLPAMPEVDQQAVESLLLRFPEEWRLWEQVAENFQTPHYHSAYLSYSARQGNLEKAAVRYSRHQKMVAPVADMREQADAADLMLNRIHHLTLMQLEHRPQHEAMENSRLYYKLKLLVCFCAGLILVGFFLGRWLLH